MLKHIKQLIKIKLTVIAQKTQKYQKLLKNNQVIFLFYL